MKRFIPLLSILILLVSCIYTGAGRTDLVRKMGSAGDAVITADIRRLRESSLKGLLPEGYEEVLERTDRIAIALSPNGDGYPLPAAEWDVEGIAFGRLSATEVGTLLRWLPDYVHSRTGEYYRATDGSGEIGIPEDGIVLFSSSSYGKAYESIFVDSREHIPASASDAMESALIGIWIDDPETFFPLGFDLPYETVEKIERAVLLADAGEDGGIILSGDIAMDSEDSARTMQIFLRNLLVQEIRRTGGHLDVKALSGIFTYEGAAVHIDGYMISNDKVRALLSEE